MLSVAQAVNVHVVSVANKQNELKYFPESVQAQPGDMVQFQFMAGNHTVTQSSFDKPCTPILMNGTGAPIRSGFQPVSASPGKVPVFTVMVNDTKPIWLYCAQGAHCQMGMVMVINENTAANSTRTLDLYKKKAAEVPRPGANGTATPSASGTGTGAAPASSSTKPPATAGAGSIATSSIGASTMLLVLGAGFMLL